MFGRLRPEKTGKSEHDEKTRRSIDGMRNPLLRKREDAARKVSAERKDEAAWKNTETIIARSGDSGEQLFQEETQKRQVERRQNRIINYLNAELMVSVTPEEIVGLDSRSLRELKRERKQSLQRAALEASEPRTSVEQRVKFLQRLAAEEITAEDEQEFLLVVRGPLGQIDGDASKMLVEIRQDQRKLQILAMMLGLKMTDGQKIDEKILTDRLTRVEMGRRDYRTPIEAVTVGRKFLRVIQPKVSEELYRKYEKSLEELLAILYGEKWEYYRQMKQLKAEARELSMAGEMLEVSARRPEVVEVGSDRSSEMLGRAVIDGDPWRGGQIERHLNTHNLAEAKLGPTYEVRVDAVSVFLSRLFYLPNGYVGVIVYVPEGDSVQVRAYYRNNAQVLWKYLPDYTRRSDGAMEKYCLGQSQESVTLPAEMQGALAEIEHKYGVVGLEGAREVAEFYVAGTAHAYNSLQEYQTLWSYGRMKGDYYAQVSRDPLNHDFGLNGLNQKKAPYTLSIDYNRAPDFGQKIVEFETSTTDTGPIMVEGFASHDGQYNWMFCRDTRGRAWIEWVEAVSPLTSLGLRRDWVTMGDFTTSLYEHTNQAGIYGDQNDTKGARQGMWKNYLSNIPLIREYCERSR